MAEAVDEASWSTATWPLGPTWQEEGSATFAVFAPASTRVVLELYDEASGTDATAEFVMGHNEIDGIWRAQLRGVDHGSLYAFRCWGRNWPFEEGWARGNSRVGFVTPFDEDGNRFNPNKVLYDPYARELTHDKNDSEIFARHGHDPGMFGTGHEHFAGVERREFDTGRWAPKGVLIRDHTWTGERPFIPAQDAAIYEAHVRNLTAHPSSSNLRATLADLAGFEQVADIPPELRGTYAGAALMAPYLKGLGFTTIEFLPVQESETGQDNDGAWGYMTMAYFAPNRDFAHDKSYGGPTREFKDMIRSFHDHGLEVYLDVVYNHSGEGGHWAGDLDTIGFVSMGGFGTDDYYMMTNDQRLIDGATGCSNQFNFSRPGPQGLVLDSLTYWADVMGVDGFRFDLAPVLGRKPDEADREDWERQRRFYPDHPLLLAIRDMARERDLEVIAEAWDLWGYEVGNFPKGWGEWNGRYRDAIRRFLKGDANADAFMEMMNGDYHRFAQSGPQSSVNFITAHDGFTLMDLVSYNEKQNNGPYPFGPSDGGSDDNISWDSGGDTALRRQRLRNLWTVLFFSRGVPMMVSGDEYGRTQNGNNNPWRLDTVGMWNNWAQARTNAPTRLPVDPERPNDPEIAQYHDNFGEADCDPAHNPLFMFTTYVARLHRGCLTLRQRYWGDMESDDDDVSYLYSRSDSQSQPQTTDRALQLHIDSPIKKGEFRLLINMLPEKRRYIVPTADPGAEWRLIIDTAAWAEPQYNCWTLDAAAPVEGEWHVEAWSIVVLQEVPKVV